MANRYRLIPVATGLRYQNQEMLFVAEEPAHTTLDGVEFFEAYADPDRPCWARRRRDLYAGLSWSEGINVLIEHDRRGQLQPPLEV